MCFMETVKELIETEPLIESVTPDDNQANAFKQTLTSTMPMVRLSKVWKVRLGDRRCPDLEP